MWASQLLTLADNWIPTVHRPYWHEILAVKKMTLKTSSEALSTLNLHLDDRYVSTLLPFASFKPLLAAERKEPCLHRKTVCTAK